MSGVGLRFGGDILDNIGNVLSSEFLTQCTASSCPALPNSIPSKGSQTPTRSRHGFLCSYSQPSRAYHSQTICEEFLSSVAIIASGNLASANHTQGHNTAVKFLTIVYSQNELSMLYIAGDRPDHRHNTNRWGYFSGLLKHLSCLAAKAIVAQ